MKTHMRARLGGRSMMQLCSMLIVFFCIIIIFAVRLMYLQVHQQDFFSELGKKNFFRTTQIDALRGNLYDCNGVLLATNKPIFDLYWQGYGMNRSSDALITLLHDAQEIVGVPFSQRAVMLAERQAREICLHKNISFDQLCQLSERCSGYGRLHVKHRFQRVYPFKSLASHILGYLNRIEDSGQQGLEKLFHDDLKGERGFRTSVMNSTGRVLAEKDYQPAQAGKDLRLTLDIYLQQLAEKLFSDDQVGTFILMDPEDGAIRALVSHPAFDPNLFLQPISSAEWQEHFVKDNPFLKRFVGAYPPASIFKLVTVAAGLEEGIIAQDEMFSCCGYLRSGDRKYYCQRRWGHGSIELKDALAVSCNVLCFSIAQQMSIDTLAAYARRFGLGSKTNFLLPEKAGLVPTSEWKMIIKGERWWPGDTLSASIGQSYLLTTPLQIARMISAICSGHLVKPRILENEAVEKEPLQISQLTRSFLVDTMQLAVSSGTVRRLGYLKKFQIHAKTGTAQTCSLQMKKTCREHYEHAWVSGFFRYQNERPLTMIILVEHAGSSLPAVQIAEKFLRGYRDIRKN